MRLHNLVGHPLLRRRKPITLSNTCIAERRPVNLQLRKCLLCCTTLVSNISFNIKRVSKYNRQYVSFCVTLQDPHDMDIVFKHPWRGGIVVEPFRNHTRPDSPRGPLYTQRYGHSPRHDRINKRNVPAPRQPSTTFIKQK